MATSQTTAADTVSARVSGYGISYAITAILNAIIVILKEGSEAVHDFMASITGHHWITHGLVLIIVFVVLGAVLSRRETGMSGNALITTVVGATVLSGLVIFGYFAV